MLFLPDPGLSDAAARRLREWQGEVDAVAEYEERVTLGKKRFGARNRKGNASFGAVRATLATMCAGARRCVYCEDSVADEVEHIKPKDLYPEDVFRWENYVYACGPCNGGKNNRFAVFSSSGPLDVTRKRGAAIVPPVAGDPVFIDPRHDDPLALLTIDLLDTFMMMPAYDLSESDAARADFTIDTLDLNRDLLLEARLNAYGGYRSRLFEYCKRRDAGAGDALLATMRDDLLATPHPTMWEEMKRQAPMLDDLRDLFGMVPEANGWGRGADAVSV